LASSNSVSTIRHCPKYIDARLFIAVSIVWRSGSSVPHSCSWQSLLRF
jgi:hypothetical protein